MPDERIGVAVYGLMRSGTTLVSDLLTVRGRSLVISEPDLFVPWDNRKIQAIHAMMREFGLAVPEDPPARDKYGNYFNYFDQVLLPYLQPLDFWGVKQVQFLFWRELFRYYLPGKLVLCVRDLREIALSAFDLIGRMGLVFGSNPVMRDEAWLLVRLCHDVHEMMVMASLPHLLLRYEDLVSGNEARSKLARYIGMDRLGTDRLNLELEPASRSAWEKSKHSETITNKSLGRYQAEPDGPAKAYADRIWKILPGFSQYMGYEVPEPGNWCGHHSLAFPGESAGNPVKQSLLDWGPEQPIEFEPLFARRHARVAAAEKIIPGDIVLDLGCVVPALKYLISEKCVYIGSDVSERFAGCLAADYNSGELPSCDGVTVVTVLGLLEHIEDVPRFIRRLKNYNATVLLAYHAADDTVCINRPEYGWKNSLTREELVTIIRAAGFDCQPNWAFDGKQSLLRLSPVKV